MKEQVLQPIKETSEDYEAIEAEIKKLFREEIYLPILKLLKINRKVIMNAPMSLIEAIMFGQITFYRGQFKGRFTPELSKALSRLGAQWDRKQGSWKIPSSSLPMDIVEAISASEDRFNQKIKLLDKSIANLVPEQIADKIQLSKLFDSAIYKVEKKFQDNVKKITVAPELSRETRKKIADEWAKNMNLYIQDFTQKQIKELRKKVQTHVFEGSRNEELSKIIKASYGVSERKAKFLARQETSLLMAKYKSSKYREIGSEEYIWGCVKMPHDKSPNQHTPGNVRYYHGILEGTRQRWDSPPASNEKGNHHNPGEDYNCRCFPMPVIKFK